jgi:hypothetical protein
MRHSWSAKLLAVRRVTQDNRGKKTAGIDGVKSMTAKQRLRLAQTLTLEGTASPVRRAWIPKPGTPDKSPLGIPTMTDRARQTVVKYALEPEWEARFAPNSYGFRPRRSCHAASIAIRTALAIKPNMSSTPISKNALIGSPTTPYWPRSTQVQACNASLNPGSKQARLTKAHGSRPRPGLCKGVPCRPCWRISPGAGSGAKVLERCCDHERVGGHVRPLASAAVKHAGDGQLPEDHATGERDADPPAAGVEETTSRASR